MLGSLHAWSYRFDNIDPKLLLGSKPVTDIATRVIQVIQQKCYLLFHIQSKAISSGSCNEIDYSGSPNLFQYPQLSTNLSITSAGSLRALLNDAMSNCCDKKKTNKQTPWPLVRERTIPTERPPLVDEI
jgi:hypothetical protein